MQNITLQAVKAIIKEFTGQANVISIPRALVRFMGDYESAAAMAQLVYWTDRTSDPDGWIFKTAKDWREELELSPAQVRRVSKRLAECGIEMVFKKNPRHGTAPVWHYRLNWELFAELFAEFLDIAQRGTSTICTLDIAESATSMDIAESATSMNKESKPTPKPTDTTLRTPSGVGGGGCRDGKLASGRKAPQPTPSSAPPPPAPRRVPDPATNTYDYLLSLDVSKKRAQQFADLDRDAVAACWDAMRAASPDTPLPLLAGRLVRKLESNPPAPIVPPPPPTPAEDDPDRPAYMTPEEWRTLTATLLNARGDLAGSWMDADGKIHGYNDLCDELIERRGYQALIAENRQRRAA